MIKHWLLAAAVLASISTAFAQTAPSSQPYPTRPVRMIVPFAAGGASDTSARIVAQKLSERMGQQFVVENRGGAGGTIGAAAAAKSNPDGYTLLLGSSTEMVTSPHIYKSVPYDTARDFAPISHVASQPLILVVHPSVPAKSVNELIALAKARPEQLNCASAGTGSTLHLAQVLFENAAQVKFTHIPFNGSPQAAAATLSGDTQVNFGTVPATLELVRGGKLRALAVTSAKRQSAMPDIPTLAESGLPGYEMLIWTALFAPRGTPPEIVGRLGTEVARILEAPDVREAFAKLGTDVSATTPEQLAAYVASEWAKMAKVVAASGAKID
jgi:tripartite-type tricarboxylate transporter receptor subunit TctC